MKAFRWRLRTMLGLVVLAALLFGAVRWLMPGPDPGWIRARALEERVQNWPRSANLEATLLASLNDPHPRVRATALWGLVQIDSKSMATVDALVASLEGGTGIPSKVDRWDPIKLHAVNALERLDPPPSYLVPKLRKALANPDDNIRFWAADCLAHFSSSAGQQPAMRTGLILGVIRDPKYQVRAPIIKALPGMHLDKAEQRQLAGILLEQLQDPDRPTQLLAAAGLSALGDEAASAAPILGGRLRNRDLRERLLDLDLIGQVGPPAIAAVPAVVEAMTSPDAEQSSPFFRNGFAPMVNNRGFYSTQSLFPSKNSPSTPLELGAEVLSRIGPEADRLAIGLLIERMKDNDPETRSRAAQALGELGPRAAAALPALIEMAAVEESDRSDGHWIRARRYLPALEKIDPDDPRLRAELVRMLGSEDPSTRIGAASILERLRPPVLDAVPELIAGLKDPVQGVRFQSARTLGSFDGPQRNLVIPALLDALEDGDVNVVGEALDALHRLQARDERLTRAAIRHLGVKNSNLRVRAAKILGRLGPAAESAIPALREALDDPSRDASDAAEEALASIAPGTESPRKSDPDRKDTPE